jgi:hypothetical protein
MYTETLFIKLPKIIWTPLATTGTFAILGSYVGNEIPNKTSRFITAIDGTITINIYSDGIALITGDKDPVTMPLCLSQK